MLIHRVDWADSTNSLAKDYPLGSVVIAEVQTKGRGRFNRKWMSGKGGLWFSITVQPKRKFCEYSFIASLAVFDALPIKADIKWPNDLLVGDKKLCGILTEISSSGSKADKVIVGIGLNVNNRPPEEGISVKEKCKKEVDEQKLLQKILDNFNRYVDLDLKTIIRRYKKYCVTLGKRVQVQTLHETYVGLAKDIDEEGNLVIETRHGIVRATEGESTIIKK